MATRKITPGEARLGKRKPQPGRPRRLNLGEQAILLAKSIRRKDIRAAVEWDRLPLIEENARLICRHERYLELHARKQRVAAKLLGSPSC
jgi:hypothetical protein